MLFLDGVNLTGREQSVFRRLPAPRPQALEQLIQTISQRLVAKAHQRRQLERLCRYDVQGSTSVARGRKPGAAITRLAALVSKPRVNLTRFHEISGLNSPDWVDSGRSRR